MRCVKVCEGVLKGGRGIHISYSMVLHIIRADILRVA